LIRETLEEMDADGTVLHGDFRPGGTEREWCDPEVLRQIKKRSLARLRREVEPVDGAAYARFLQRWQGVGNAHRGPDRLRDVIGQLEGLPIAASVLEREILNCRVADFEPAMVDSLMSAGEVAWFGAGQVGKDDGRVVLVRREMLEHFAPARLPVEGELQAKLVAALEARGALFFADLVSVAGAPHMEVLEALWALVWAGAVTNDTLAPVRALSWHKRTSGPAPRGRLGRLPPESAGRWSLVRMAPSADSRAAATARSHAVAESLLERLGIVTREGATAEDIAGGFSAVYPVLKAMEDAGRVRRGYFVEGLGAAQFALPGAAERVRAERELPDETGVVILAATDPAQPYGATLAWPRDSDEARKSYQRVAGARLALVDGLPVLYIDRSRKGLLTFPGNTERTERLAIEALANDPASLGSKGLSVERIDGAPADESRIAPLFREAGFSQGFRGLTRRPPRAEAFAHA